MRGSGSDGHALRKKMDRLRGEGVALASVAQLACPALSPTPSHAVGWAGPLWSFPQLVLSNARIVPANAEYCTAI